MEPESKKEGAVKWERFLPRMALRVLLVEADDCTRQIISVLLRKCSYKVASVADGLKAWEILKARPHEIDLILTEVDLPAISGFTLLSLIMEHDTCKNIPVIMMSSHDSVSTVYSCMLRGAADYLVKPIRRNELRNLWQHVWRRQSATIGGNQPQSESEAQQKVEGTSENNAACNDSSSFTGSAQRNNEHIGKGSDAQSSCTRPEAESAHVEIVQNFSQSIEDKSYSGGSKLLNNETHLNIDQKLIEHCCEPGGSARDSCKDANTTTTNKNIESEIQRKNGNLASEASDNNYALVNPSREAIDLIGAFSNYQNCSYKNASSASKFDSSPQLDLSLKRSHPSCFEFESQVTEKSHMIKHSNASAFTRYTNRPLQRLHPTPTSDCTRQNEYGADTYSPMITTQKSTLSLATNLSEQSDVPLSGSQQRVYPVPVPVREIKFSNICTGFGPVHPSMFCTPSVPSPTPSPSSASHLEPTFRGSLFHQYNVENRHPEQLCGQLGQNTNNCTNQSKHKLGHEHESLEESRHISLATDQTASSSFRNSAGSHLNSIGYGSICGSNSNVDHAAPKTPAQSKNEEGLSSHGGSSHRSLQREAALTKFRLKRKERCYEKKVRYESRKQLAEKRPRVKGQFVRQLQSDHTLAESEKNHREN